MKRLLQTTALGAIALLSACANQPPYSRPAQDLPAQYPAETALVPATQGRPSEDWRDVYREPVLVQLIEQALRGNRDIQLAAARALEAQSYVRVAQFAYLPTVDATAAASRARSSQLTGNLPAGVDPVRSQNSVNLVASLELDLWRRITYLAQAAKADALAFEHNLRAVELAVVSTTASAYFALLELDDEVRIGEASLVAQRRFLELTQVRRANGAASGLDVAQAEAAAEQTRAILEDSRRRQRQALHALNVVLGRFSGDVERPQSVDPALEPPPPTGLPADLLNRRPDLLAAEAALRGSYERIGAARASIFPQIVLTAATGSASSQLSDLFTGPARTWSYGVNVVQGIIDANRSFIQVDAAKARRDQALAQYQGATEQAFREVLDALVAQEASRIAIDARQRQVAALERAESASMLRYKTGAVSYFEVIDAQRNLLSARLALVQARLATRLASVELYRAVGGGWTPRSEQAS
jgi:multidrug efflux system outer membrane protein